MGDSLRNVKFAKFVKTNFPRAASILIIADGKGELAREVSRDFDSVRVIEAKPRFVGTIPKNVIYQKGWFDCKTAVYEDLIVGMHPDEATVEIILAANKYNKPFAVVPCCVKGPVQYTRGVKYNQWLKVLKRLAGNCNETILPIGGKNNIIYRR